LAPFAFVRAMRGVALYKQFFGFAAAFALSVAAAAAKPAPDGFSELVEKLSPGVVNIATERTGEAAAASAIAPSPSAWDGQVTGQGEGKAGRSLGSGFVIDSSGLIVTNNHVVEGAKEIYVALHNGRRLKATVAGRDRKTDIALLRVQPKGPLAALSFGNSDEAKAGDWVLAIGNPFGLGGSVSVGLVSARNRQLDAELYDDFIQTDAAINRGNSGGPLFDMDGKVVGVNSAILSPSGGSIGIGFAIPSNTAATIVAQLRAKGRVERGWIGANVEDLNDERAGARVGRVAPGGPAAAAGLRAGDVVVRIGGTVVRDSRMMQRLVVEAPVGQVLNVELMRAGRAVAANVKIARRKENGAR
jgi:serine protease Do